MESRARIVDFETARKQSRTRAAASLRAASGAPAPRRSSQRSDQANPSISTSHAASRGTTRASARRAASGSASPARAHSASSNRRPAPHRAADDAEAAAAPRAALASFDAGPDRGRSARSRRAERLFERSYGSDAPAADSSGPRAALYEGRMGRTHRKSASMQTPEAASAFLGVFGRIGSGVVGALSSLFGAKGASGVASRIGAALAVIGVCAVLVYPSAKTYYASMRDAERAEAELAAVSAYTAQLSGEVDALKTDAGVEDRAREKYGWVREGENAVIVSGLPEDGTSKVTYEKMPDEGDIPAPETWYSPALDAFFGYSAS